MLRPFAILAPLVVLAAACAPLPEEPVTPEPQDSCGAEGYQGLVGQNARVITGINFAGPVRVIGPGDMVTMDFAPNRINFATDEAGRITRVYCS
ncbi:I78 family peptidase inhibitor [Halodurantibacterium flavum]|uniref:I78 family peptidase inhibitor n=1 Tax=Halodurantibacterium flavum TaxID=1382802 RepID=A0ABW4S8X0_9RHOB